MTQTSGITNAEAARPAARTASVRLLGFGAVVAVVGALLAILGGGTAWAVGLSLLALSAPSLLMGLGLPSPATVQQWMTDEHAV